MVAQITLTDIRYPTTALLAIVDRSAAPTRCQRRPQRPGVATSRSFGIVGLVGRIAVGRVVNLGCVSIALQLDEC